MFTNIDTPCGDYYRIDPMSYDHLEDHVIGLIEQLTKPKEDIDMAQVLFNLEEVAWSFRLPMNQFANI